ncbi:MAG: DUF2905 domain-containing protein [Bryobacteraceae bacterium]
MNLGRGLISAGALLLVAGFAVLLTEKANIRLGQLPGDIVFRGKYGTMYLPIATCLLLSLLISAAMWIIQRFR